MSSNFSNEMKLEFPAAGENERLARAAVSAFLIPLDPTTEELAEIKTSVSEAVSNCIIHGYRSALKGRIIMECRIDGSRNCIISITDFGCGIDDIEKAREPLFTTGDEKEQSGMGFTVMESFMDRIEVKSEKDKGTQVTMSKRLDSPAISGQEFDNDAEK